MEVVGYMTIAPVTCRTMGTPTETDGLVAGACEGQAAVPAVRVPSILREEEALLAEHEVGGLAVFRETVRREGEEILVPYGFLKNSA